MAIRSASCEPRRALFSANYWTVMGSDSRGKTSPASTSGSFAPHSGGRSRAAVPVPPMHLPGYGEWWSGGGAEAHFGHDTANAECPRCAVTPLMKKIHAAVFDSTNHTAASVAWEYQDGYGEAGYEPPQGWDWSGIRDSSPAAIWAIGEALSLLD